MPKQEGSKADVVRAFLAKNPSGTFKDFDKEKPDVLTSAYFATMKSILKKKGEASGEAPKKRGRPPKAATEAKVVKATNGRRKAAVSTLQDKIDDQKEFLGWVESGMAKGWVEKLKEHL